ncbi:MAG: TonB-dependent receptor [Sphingopyxis sp.]|uniref:TonB-dependent receptor domain-containing protein n=1 Tax=Sphingopyxis sp. TaxID=1908224 RepID=UPI002ABCEAE3|nr:TonB-dependent receptor [Sphingopyxis sp.]MDZ3831768.1 TonB-dependent receptor [Sphingopyxis sp.]
MKKTQFSRLKLGAAPVVLGVALISTPAFAQDAEEGASSETIIVTGSRIASPNITSLPPVQTVTAENIQQSGAVNIQELLLENPAFGTPALSRTNSAFLTSGTGVATVDLRDLGSDRTLVLINNRRVVAGVPGTATVDLNIIPTQFVERVDVLTGGASSLYGSDAVGGVVNFIYKSDFEGFEAEGQYGITERGDSARIQTNLTFGGNFSDNRGNIMVHLGYSDEKGLLSRQRKNTFSDDVDRFAFITGDPADYGVSAGPFFSSFPPQGRFTVGDNFRPAGDYTFTFGPNGQLQPCFTTNGPTCNSQVLNSSGGVVVPGIGTGVGPNGFNRQFFRTLAVPVKRYLFAARGHYDITDDIRFVAEGTYAKTTASREIEPFALDVANIYPVTGRAPIETMVNGVAVLNPYVPAAIAAVATDVDGDGLRDMGFARRLTEVGTRNGSTARDTFRVVLGLEGGLFDDKFRWDVSYNYGRTTESQRSNGQVNVLNFANAMSAITDVDDLDGDGSRTDVVCASATARAQGCAPINIFGEGSISPEALNYIAAQQSFQTDIRQQVFTANLSGELFDLPAGPVGIAVGGEYRKESSSEDNDALTNAGLNAGNAIPDTAGSFNVKELYGEINIPVLADTAFFHSLNLRAAGRVSDYSTVGTVYSYSFGADWAPVEDIRFRGTFARAVRAPNVGELYQGPSQTFPTGLQDPCAGIGASGGGDLGTRCRADAGVSLNIAQNGTFTLNQADLQGISGFNSGNLDLFEETSDSYTLGVVITPRSIAALRNLTLSVDYYNIKIKDAIVAPPRQFILNQCYQQGNDQFCDLIQRRQIQAGSNSPGSLEFIDAPLVNGGRLKAEGIDVVAGYRTPVLNGSLSMRISYNHVLDGYVIPVPGAPKDPFAGEIGTARDRFTANLGYQEDKFGITFTGTYIGKSYEDDQFLAEYDLGPKDISIPAQFYLDTQMTYRPADAFEFFFGIDNLLDNKAPNILSGSPFNVTGADTAADVYDIFGRRYYAGVRLKF